MTDGTFTMVVLGLKPALKLTPSLAQSLTFPVLDQVVLLSCREQLTFLV